MKLLLTVIAFCCAISIATGQVSEIKDLSSEESSAEGRSRSNGNGLYLDIAIQSLGFFIAWQEETLRKRAENVNIVSLEAYLQAAIQPSSYYIVQPRLRGNWGIFSTDFRVSYLLEEGLDGVAYLRTDDWQIIQLNLVTLSNVTFRVGGGIIHEDFSGGKTFSEWSTGLQLLNDNHRVGGLAEYRWSTPRKEVAAHVQLKLFGTNHSHLYATLGTVYQRYYKTVDVWGIQTGLMLRVN